MLMCFCRNTESKDRRKAMTPSAFDKDYIDENTDFKYLFPKLETERIQDIYYLNNFMPFSPYYRNSHFSKKNMERYYKFGGFIHRISDWKLPYKSTLIVPLVTFGQNGKSRRLQGFLSVDSPNVWAFSSRYDLPMLLILAEAFAPIVEKYIQSNLLHNS